MRKKLLIVAVLLGVGGVAALFAQETLETLGFSLDVVWLFIGSILVFIMQAGFALVETGLTRAKNATNITMKNVMDFCFGAIVYWAVGWGFMYGTSAGGLIGTDQFFNGPMLLDMESGNFYKSWFFQVVFAATAATIVSGAMAERTKFKSYLIYTCFISAFIYPISGHWVWGGGWLANLGFHDFAGSTVVHSVGGWAALMGAAVLGPRIGKYVKGADGTVTVKAFPGHNIPYAALGVLLLFFGWFGFNGASTGIATIGEGGIWSGLNIARVAVTTCLAASAGAVGALVFSWIWFKKPDCSMTLNGLLAGLVAITAPCAVVSPGASIIIGLIGGVLVVLAVEFIDKVLKIDDPVGAASVHLVCGIFGTLAVGIWANAPDDGVVGILHGGGFAQLGIQAVGVVSVGAWAAITSLILFLAIKAVVGLRVSPKEEMVGLDLSEHKSEAYTGFQIFSNM
ncbi:ammonium transporter [Leadbettera azotonutricia]|uniref:Ammonium transporter n=1 Tax=Leadbettera azotonutricia (strain ATCC BAA-888 / DSM 13862 / ZAS-9) TaxID=545695 RepID=F5YBR4_LEAAZ|nr:ammonium transporter [Leadbettera azotonutricia]AEF82156.1 ammonium transporter [Leadbettera azotonutricia ZAS-9]